MIDILFMFMKEKNHYNVWFVIIVTFNINFHEGNNHSYVIPAVLFAIKVTLDTHIIFKL